MMPMTAKNACLAKMENEDPLVLSKEVIDVADSTISRPRPTRHSKAPRMTTDPLALPPRSLSMRSCWLFHDDDCPTLISAPDVPVPTGEAADDCLDHEQHDEDDERYGP